MNSHRSIVNMSECQSIWFSRWLNIPICHTKSLFFETKLSKIILCFASHKMHRIEIAGKLENWNGNSTCGQFVIENRTTKTFDWLKLISSMMPLLVGHFRIVNGRRSDWEAFRVNLPSSMTGKNVSNRKSWGRSVAVILIGFFRHFFSLKARMRSNIKLFSPVNDEESFFELKRQRNLIVIFIKRPTVTTVCNLYSFLQRIFRCFFQTLEKIYLLTSPPNNTQLMAAQLTSSRQLNQK